MLRHLNMSISWARFCKVGKGSFLTRCFSPSPSFFTSKKGCINLKLAFVPLCLIHIHLKKGSMKNCSCSEVVFWHTITPGWMAAAWQRGEDTPQSTVIGMLEHCSFTSERREQGGCGAHINRACSTPAPPDEARMGGNREELRPDKTCVTTGGNGDKHPLDLQHD